tara:strand:+ start:413 stop:760 length:348 start_codon:yes stop_codon:yes gene_type:complete
MSNTLTIYHNPRCSKSRETLNLIRAKNINPKVHLYLEKPLNENEIKVLLKQLNKNPEDIIRKKEDIYKKLSLKNSDTTKLIQEISKNPILLERPIVSNGKKAIIGRPPENVFSLL